MLAQKHPGGARGRRLPSVVGERERGRDLTPTTASAVKPLRVGSKLRNPRPCAQRRWDRGRGLSNGCSRWVLGGSGSVPGPAVGVALLPLLDLQKVALAADELVAETALMGAKDLPVGVIEVRHDVAPDGQPIGLPRVPGRRELAHTAVGDTDQLVQRLQVPAARSEVCQAWVNRPTAETVASEVPSGGVSLIRCLAGCVVGGVHTQARSRRRSVRMSSLRSSSSRPPQVP